MPNLSPVAPSATRASAAPPLFDARRQATFCENLSHHGNVRLACRAAGISPQTAYRARRSSPDFGACWDAALVLARDHVEEVLADRALNGVEEVVYYHGEEIGRRIRYDNRLLLAHLARLDRLADQMEERGPVLFDDALDALEQGRPVAGKGRAPAPPAKESEGEDAIPPLERRLRAMEEARPADAPRPDTLGPWGEVEAVQLAAFEAGEPNWWLAAPGRAGEQPAVEPEGAEEPEPLTEWERQAALWNPVPGQCSMCSSDGENGVLSPQRSDVARHSRQASQTQLGEWVCQSLDTLALDMQEALPSSRC